MTELKKINAYLPTFDNNYNEFLLVSHTKENYASAKQIECYIKEEVDNYISKLKDKNKSLKRALYKACANWAHISVAFFSSYVTKDRWKKMEKLCVAKADKRG